MEATSSDPAAAPSTHRTIDRVTDILETVVYRPGITFAELAKAIDAPKSSLHGFVRGLLAKGWLLQDDRRYYLGPVLYSLTLVSGTFRAGEVSTADLDALHDDTGLTVFLGVESSDQLIYVGESGTDALTGYAARSNIRRELVATAGGKALLAARADAERDAYLRRASAEHPDLVSRFLAEITDIRSSRIARNVRYEGAQLALATVVRDRADRAVAAVVILGPTEQLQRRESRLRKTMLQHVDGWAQRRPRP